MTELRGRVALVTGVGRRIGYAVPARWAGLELDTIIGQDAVGRLATARMRPSTSAGSVVDLLFASFGIEPDIVAAAEVLEVLTGVTVPVAQTGHLIALKVLARDDVGRPQDLVDLRAAGTRRTARRSGRRGRSWCGPPGGGR